MDNIIQGPSVNPMDYPTAKCEKCGNELFEPNVIFKEIPGLVVGKTEPYYYPMKVFVCTKCGELSPLDKQINAEIERISSASGGKSASEPTPDLII